MLIVRIIPMCTLYETSNWNPMLRKKYVINKIRYVFVI